MILNLSFPGNKVNSLHSGHYGDLQLVSSLARVRNNGSLFQSNIYNIIITDNLFIFALDLAAVCIIRVSARQELTVSLASNCALYGLC